MTTISRNLRKRSQGMYRSKGDAGEEPALLYLVILGSFWENSRVYQEQTLISINCGNAHGSSLRRECKISSSASGGQPRHAEGHKSLSKKPLAGGDPEVSGSVVSSQLSLQ